MAWAVRNGNRWSGRFRDLDGKVKTTPRYLTKPEAIKSAEQREAELLADRQLRTRFAMLRFTRSKR